MTTVLPTICDWFKRYFVLAGSPYHSLSADTAAMIQRKLPPQFSLAVPSALAAETAATDKSVAKEISTFTIQNGDDL